MQSLKILHLASFHGNIGDNANHMGFRPWLECLSDRQIEWSNLEIREFFWRERAWDESFVNLVNQFDALIIGGGNYFELWVESSPTGTSIAIPPDLFSKIKIPIFFNALGVDPGQGVPDSSRIKFMGFLDTLLGSEQYLVSVRNDGAKKNLSRHVGNRYSEAVLHAPDNGFFVEDMNLEENIDNYSAVDQKILAINLAGDMGNVRYSNFHGTEGGLNMFSREFSECMVAIGEEHPEVHFLMIPHIYRDIEILYKVINNLPDRLRRTRLAVSPYGVGDKSAQRIFGMYKSADMVLGMRFHANVCSLGMEKETLGLFCYPQISALYEELDQMDRLIDITKPGFYKSLAKTVIGGLNQEVQFKSTPKDAKKLAEMMRDRAAPNVQNWINNVVA